MQEILADLAARQVIFSLAGKDYVHRDTAAEARQKILELVADFHRQSPESPGLPPEQLRQAMPIDKAVLDALLARLKERKPAGGAKPAAGPARTSQHLRRRGRQAVGDDRRRCSATKPFSPPDAAEVASRTGTPPAKVAKMLGLLREHGRLVQVDAAGMLFHRDAVARAREILAEHFRKEGRLESVQFKYLLDTTRKFALPMLDYMDRLGLTRRVGNTRFPKNPPAA